MKGLYSENNKTLMKYTEEGIYKWKDMHVHELEKLTLLK